MAMKKDEKSKLKKLTLRREAIRQLTAEDLGRVRGGMSGTTVIDATLGDNPSNGTQGVSSGCR
jgi:hypothetical protein